MKDPGFGETSIAFSSPQYAGRIGRSGIPVRWAVLLGALTILLTAAAAYAVEASSGPNVLPPKLEKRYQHITEHLRCPVCQNETIAVSQSVISKDLRRIVRQKLLAGESDVQIRHYMISRYGLFAVYNPPIGWNTGLLWFGPAILFLIAVLIGILALRHRRRMLAARDSASAREWRGRPDKTRARDPG